MTRFRASAIHLLISAAIVSVVFLVIFFIWYPGATFTIAGALSIVFMLVAVDVVLGPLLTLIIYREGKPGLRFDLWFIACVQLVALSFGAFTLYQERPYYLVFAVDRFNMVTENQINKSKIQFEELREKPFAGVIKVYARMPEGEAFQQFLESVMFEGEADLEARPEFWEPYSNGEQVIIDASRSLTELERDTEKDERRVQHAIKTYSSDHPSLGFVPIGTLKKDIGMIMDMETAEPLGVIKVNPWLSE